MRDHSARWWTGPALMLGAVGVALVFIECAVELVLNHPGVLLGQPHLVAVARYYHRGRDRQVVQVDPRCVRWEAELGYLMRDDEESLRDPAIVVAGDSYAMGWGVAHDDSFAERIGQALGARVLNTGIASYDTARELALLERLGIRSARAVVIQYCFNDDAANRSYVEEGRLLTSTEARFAAELEEAQRFRRRYFGKNLVTIATRMVTGPSDRGGGTPGDPKSAYYFLETLRRYQSLLAGKVVVVLTEISNRDRAPFIAAGRALLADPRYAELAAIVSFADSSPELDVTRSYYPLDGHLNATGHAQEAAAVVAELRRRGVSFAGG